LISKKSSISCKSTGANNTEEKESITTYDDRAHTKMRKMITLLLFMAWLMLVDSFVMMQSFSHVA